MFRRDKVQAGIWLGKCSVSINRGTKLLICNELVQTKWLEKKKIKHFEKSCAGFKKYFQLEQFVN